MTLMKIDSAQSSYDAVMSHSLGVHLCNRSGILDILGCFTRQPKII